VESNRTVSIEKGTSVQVQKINIPSLPSTVSNTTDSYRF
jgi:hypothetical protein